MITNLYFSIFMLTSFTIFFQKNTHFLCYFIQSFKFLIILHEHIWIYFVYKNFEGNIWINLMSNFNYIEKFIAWCIFILFMGINHIYQRTTLFQKFHILRFWILQNLISWTIFYLKLNIWIISDIYLKYLIYKSK